jgi:hypothetical protein
VFVEDTLLLENTTASGTLLVQVPTGSTGVDVLLAVQTDRQPAAPEYRFRLIYLGKQERYSVGYCTC